MAELERATVIATLVRSYTALLEQRLPAGPVTLEQIETLVEELGRQQDTELEGTLIRIQPPPPANQEVCPQCQGPAFFKRGAALEVLTIHGSRRLVTQRMKPAGMHWRKESAEAVLAIRSQLLSTASCDLRTYC